MPNPTQDTEKDLKISTNLAERILRETGQNVYLCYQCVKCTSGCPLGEYFDWQPNQIMRAVQLGQEDIALNANTPWFCAACQTCSTRCPQGLDITAIMEFLAREAIASGNRPSFYEVNTFNQAFMREVNLWGRSYELGLMAEMKLRTIRTHSILENMDLAVKILQRNKLPFIPSPTHTPRKAKPIAGANKAIAYYPGCSLHSTSREYNTSTHAVCEALNLSLIEPPGWVCCGSSAAHRSDPEAALRLPMQNLAIIEQSGFEEVSMPCAACYNRHKTALYEIRNNESHRQELNKAIGYEYQDTVEINSLYETLIKRVGIDEIASRVKKPLKGLKVVTYYGCLNTRPPHVTQASHPENPTELDDLMRALGAEVIDWSYKTTCCGAAHSLTRAGIVINLSGKLVNHAHESGADVVVVACPLCQTNLDARQFQMKLEFELPVMYFTQLMVLAFGLPVKKAALSKNIVDPRPPLRAIGILND